MNNPVARYEDFNIMSVDPNMIQTKQKIQNLGTTRPSFNTPFKLDIGGVKGAMQTYNPLATINTEPKQTNIIEETTKQPVVSSNVIQEFIADIKDKGDITIEEIQQYYPEFAGKEQVALELSADILDKGDISEEEIKQYYPELISEQMESTVDTMGTPQDIADIESKPAGQRTKEEQIKLQEYRNKGFLAGALGSVATTPTNIAAFGAELFGMPESADNLRRKSENIQDFITRRLGADDQSQDFKVGGLTTDLLTLLIPGGGAPKGAVSFSKAVNSFKNPIIRNAVKTIGLGGLGVAEANIASGITEGRKATIGEEIVGAGLNLLIPGASTLLKKLKNIEKSSPEDVVRGTYKAAPSIAEKKIMSTNKIDPSKIADFNNRYGTNPGKWLAQRDIIADQPETIQKLYDRFVKYRAIVDDALKSMDGVVIRPNDFKGDDWLKYMLDDALELAENTKSADRQIIKGLADKYNVSGLSPSEVNQIKRIYERTNKFTYNKNIAAPEKAQRATNIDSGLREKLMDKAEEYGFTNMKDINKEISASKYLIDEIAKKYDKQMANDIISLSDYVVGGGFGVESVIAKKVLTSGKIQSFIAKLLNTTQRIDDPNVDYDLIRSIIRNKLPKLPSPKATAIGQGGLPQQQNVISPIPQTPRNIIEK